MKTVQTNNSKTVLAICSIAFLTLISSATSPALAVIGENFPEASPEAIASIATLSTLTSVPFTILSGLILGRKIKFRPLIFIGLFFTLLGGILPLFATSVTQILFGRAILGIGSGISAPVMTTLILSIMKGDEVSKQFSRNSMATNFGAVIFQLLGGFLCNYNWKLPFAVYFMVIPTIIIVYLYLPEPQEMVSTGLQSVKGFDIKRIVTPHVIFWAIVHAVYMLWFYAYVTQTSGIIIRNGFGNSTVAAVVLSLFTLIGVFGGGLFHKVQKLVGMKVMVIGFLINALSYSILAFANNLFVYLLFSLTFGFGYGLLQPAMSYFLGIGLDKDYRAASLSVSTIISSLGSFFSSYAIKYCKIIFNTDSERIAFIVGGVFFLALAVLFLFVKNKHSVE